METPPQDLPFDRGLRRLRRDRAAAASAGRHDLLAHLAGDLLERLDLVTRPLPHALVLGCGSGLAEALQERGHSVRSADPGRLHAAAAHGVQCDEDRLAFGDRAFDLVVSVALLDSVNDLPGALTLIRRCLRPDGLFLGAFAGAGSLPRLRGAMAAAEMAEGLPASPHIHPQIDVRAAGDLLARAGFALPVADAEPLTVRYSSFGRLVGDLRAAGATNILASRSRRPFGRIGLAAAAGDFAAHAEADGKTPERFEIVHLSGWSPSPDQPRPARRGSGTVSLAETLRKT